MLSGISAVTLWRRYRSTPTRGTQKPLHLNPCSTDSDSPTETELCKLNSSLEALAAIFPDVRAEVLREMLSSFSEVSRLQLVTENLLKHKAKWVRGRWHVPLPQNNSAPAGSGSLAFHSKDRFRSSGYKSAVKAAFYQEFKGFSHSTIKAVMAEHNYSYADTRMALLSLASTSWRYSLANIVLRRKAPTVDSHPFLEWRTSSSQDPTPALIRVSDPEFARELEDTVLAPLLLEKTLKQVQHDCETAHLLGELEAEQTGSLFDCECCFSSNIFESITTCGQGHYMCFACVRHTLTEVVYGQGWAKSVDVDRSTLRCIALSHTGSVECDGYISRTSLQAICNDEASSKDDWYKFEQRLAQDCLTRSQVQLLRCPFCAYAEFEEVHALNTRKDCANFLIFALMSSLIIFAILLIFGFGLFGFFITSCLVLVTITRFRQTVFNPLMCLPPEDTITPPHHGRKFTCRNASCSLTSCLRCSAAWTDIHACYQSSRQALRTYVESAITEAIKRTCPQCNLAFIKSSGCNKLVCICGYTMCYVCRADIGTESYIHFCQHFRADPGQSCKECERCDLYRVEDEEVVIRRAKDAAVKEWREREIANSGFEKGIDYGWNAKQEADDVGESVVGSHNEGWLSS